MLLVPKSQVRDEIVVESIGAVGERDGLEALGVCLGAAHVLARVGHGSTGADFLAEERHVGFVGGLEVGGREGREAGDEGGDGVAHGDCLRDMKFGDWERKCREKCLVERSWKVEFVTFTDASQTLFISARSATDLWCMPATDKVRVRRKTKTSNYANITMKRQGCAPSIFLPRISPRPPYEQRTVKF
jgi:hypothetical protein